MKSNFIFATALLGLCACESGKDVSTVHIYGQIIGEETDKIVMMYDGASSMLGGSKNIYLSIDNEGKFDTVIHIAEPVYYNINRNTLYLTPGDDLKMKITSDNNEAEFSGKGAEANNYMKKRLFPKAGSYLEAGRMVKESFDATKAYIINKAEERRNELASLKNVSDDFKEMENARITADVLNSYISYANYARITEKAKDGDEARNIYNEFMKGLAPEVSSGLAELNKDNNMNVAVVRSVMSRALYNKDYGWADGLVLSPMVDELFKSVEYADKLRDKATPELARTVENFISELKNKDFSKELQFMLDKASKLFPGKPAIDIRMTDIDGNELSLSDMKGKVLYIDLWATWCGPCKNEAPYFEKIAKEYEGKDILFLPISTDSNTKLWKNYLADNKKELKQYHSSDISLKSGWEIYYIPRFLIIDKNFNIVDAYAPRPSDKEVLKAILDKELSK